MPGPAATVGDMHVCPMCNPNGSPHVGGPITGPGVPSVLIGGKPAAVMGDMCTCAGPPDMIVQGEATVLVGGKPLACMNDLTAHGGGIAGGNPTVVIGTGGSGATAVMPVKKIPFPKITPVLKTMASLTGKRQQLNEAMANQEAIKNASQSTEGDKRIYGLKWVKEEKVIRKGKIFKQVTLNASVENYAEGEAVNLTVSRHIKETNAEGVEEIVDTELTTLSGTVEDKMVTLVWEIDDALTTDQNNTNN